MTINEMLIDVFVVFFCLHGPFEGSSFTKLLLAGGYESQTFELKRSSNPFHSKKKCQVDKENPSITGQPGQVNQSFFFFDEILS